jgi:hypothetical protein
MIIKEHVNLAKRAIFGLRKAKPAPNVAEKVGAGIKETSFGSPIPSLAVDKTSAEFTKLRGVLSWLTEEDLQVGESMRGVTELLKIPVRLYTNLPITIVLYLNRPDGVSATIG